MANVTDEISKLKEITDKLEQGIAELFESQKYMEYLRTMSRFYNYSFNNTLLIAMQKPDATLIAGYKAWQNNFERHVLKGEKGIRIIAPAPYKKKEAMEKIDPDTQMPVLGPGGKPVVEEVEITIPAFRVVPVFDVSQTEGKEISGLEVDELVGTVEDYTVFMQALSEVSPAPIEYETIDGGAKGYYSPADRRIAIQKDMSEIQTMKTAIHEIAHAKLHNLERNKELGIETLSKDHRTKEVEAESVAYTVCQHYGIETSDYSFAYVAGWSSGKELGELKTSLELIRKTAGELINSIDEQVQQIQIEKENDLILSPIEQMDFFEIYQLKDTDETKEYRFESMEYMRELRFKIEKDNYDLIYSAPLSEEMTLEEIFQTFNIQRPEDFHGHSLSMSDVIVLHKNGESTSHYIDRFGFEELPQFLAKDLKAEQSKNQNGAERSNYSISFYAAECMEFTNYGEYHEHLSLDEAVKIYEAIPSKRLNAGKGIGFILHNANEKRPGFEESSFDLYSSGKVDEDIINLIPEFKNNPLVQQAIQDIKKYFPSAIPQKKIIENISLKEEVDTPEKLAKALDEFSYYNDPYGYMDTTPDRDEQVRTLTVDIVAGEVERIKEYLGDIIAEGEPIDDVVSAKALIKRLEYFENAAKERAVAKEPTVTVTWSESPYLKEGAIYPLSEANRLFGELNSQQRINRERPNSGAHGYYKTKFHIEYLLGGKLHNYGGRQDFGDGEGNLIDHIRGNADYHLKDKDYLKYLKNSSQEEYDLAIKHYQYITQDYVPYLRMHCNLSEIEQSVKEAMEMVTKQTEEHVNYEGQTKYYKAMLDYITDSRKRLNAGEGVSNLLEPPKMSDYVKNNSLEKVEEFLEINYDQIDGIINNEKSKKADELEERKSSIKDRLAVNKERLGNKEDAQNRFKGNEKNKEMRIE